MCLPLQPGCSSALRDHILDWEDALPEDELQLSGGFFEVGHLCYHRLQWKTLNLNDFWHQAILLWAF